MEFGAALHTAAATLGRRVLVPVPLVGLQRKVLPHLSAGMMWQKCGSCVRFGSACITWMAVEISSLPWGSRGYKAFVEEE